MSWAEDNGYDAYDGPLERIGYANVLVGDKIKSIEYCLNCGSINIKTSKKGSKYCAEICWVAPKESEISDE